MVDVSGKLVGKYTFRPMDPIVSFPGIDEISPYHAKQCMFKAKSLKINMHLHCLIPPL